MWWDHDCGSGVQADSVRPSILGGSAGSCLRIIVQISEMVVVGASRNAGHPTWSSGRKSGAITQRLRVSQWPAVVFGVECCSDRPL